MFPSLFSLAIVYVYINFSVCLLSFAFALSFYFVLSQRYFRFVCFLLTFLTGERFIFCFFLLFYVLHIDFTHLPYRTKKKYKKWSKGGEWIIERGLFLLLFKTGKGLYFIRVHNWAFLSLSFKRFFVVFSHSSFKSVSVCVCKNRFLLVV